MGRLRVVTAAAHGPFSGAVVALVPAGEDAARLALDGFEPPEALHVTLAWLGDVEDGPEPQVGFDEAVEAIVRELAADGGPAVAADVFAHGIFNPDDPDRDPATVLLLQSEDLADVRRLVHGAVGDASSFPVWFPHLTLGFDADPLTAEQVEGRMGPVTFDRVRVAYGSEQSSDIVLEETSMTSATRRLQIVVPDKYRASLQAADPDGNGPPALSRTWEGVLIVEGSPTGDGRIFEPGSLRWDDPPIPLAWAREDLPEHQGAVVVGRILEVWRDGDKIRARGDFDLESDDGREAARLVAGDADGPILNGVSVDLDDVDVEVRVAEEVLEAEEAMFAEMIDDEDGEGEGPERQVDEEGRVTVWEFASDDEMFVTTDGRVRSATLVRVPAFVEAFIEPADTDDDLIGRAVAAFATDTLDFPCPKPFGSHSDCVDRMGDEPGIEDPDAFCAAWAGACGESADAIVAATGTRSRLAVPPAAWFADPKFGPDPSTDPRLVYDERLGKIGAPLEITRDGQVFGHIALWGTCHTGFSDCVEPPNSASGYRYFRTGTMTCDNGAEIPVGRLTFDTLHAGRRMSAVDTLAHYEHTGLQGARLAAGEDEFGIWITGALAENVTPEQIRTLKASPLSGDWRRIGGSLELVAVLAVNTPGFPVPRALVASGGVQALQSAAVLAPRETRPDASGFSDDEREVLRRMAARELTASTARRDQVERARRRVVTASAARRVRRR